MTPIRGLLAICLAVVPVSPAVGQETPGTGNAFVAPIEITSAGVTLRGTVFVAAGGGPHVTVVHLQGFPGSRSTAFEEYLQSQGFNAVSIFVRGQQTSDGLYSVAGMPDDAAAVVAFLRTDSARRTFRIHPGRITLVGGSAGSFGALRATALDPGLKCVAAIVPFNWTLAGLAARRDTTLLRGYHATIANLTTRPDPPIRTDTSFVSEVVANAERHDLRVAARSLRDRKVFLVGAQNDETAPLAEHFLPLVEAARSAAGAVVRDTIVPDTHNLTATFRDVNASTARWLRAECSN
jgi:uncharacterized protein